MHMHGQSILHVRRDGPASCKIIKFKPAAGGAARRISAEYIAIDAAVGAGGKFPPKNFRLSLAC